MKEHLRSLNLSNSVAIVTYEILRQKNFEDLEVWYLPCNNPKEMETAFLREFEGQYKQLPLANWRH